jgi:predicted NBD/HSP70 family sugar kinase
MTRGTYGAQGWGHPAFVVRSHEKVLPEHARAHNRAIVLQRLFHGGPTSRADLARATGLTPVTVSDLVGVLLAEGLVEELGHRHERRAGKPAMLVALRSAHFRVVAVDVGSGRVLQGGVSDLTGHFLSRRTLDLGDRDGTAVLELLVRFVRLLVADATGPVLGVGAAVPGIVESDGSVHHAPVRDWDGVPVEARLRAATGLPVHVVNDAGATAMCEYTFGSASGTGTLVVMVSDGVGSGLVLDGARVRGDSGSAGEIGHVRAVVDGARCACGGTGCLETVLRLGVLERRTAGLDRPAREALLGDVGKVLGAVLAPVVATLDLQEVVLSGPVRLLGGALREAAQQEVLDRTMPAVGRGFRVRTASVEVDDVLAGAVVEVLRGQLGVI